MSMTVQDPLRLKMFVLDFPASESGAFALLKLSIIDERSGFFGSYKRAINKKELYPVYNDPFQKVER